MRQGTVGRRHPRRDAEREAAQPIGNQPRAEDDEDELEKPEEKPSLLTARELQAREPGKREPADESGEEGERKPKQPRNKR